MHVLIYDPMHTGHHLNWVRLLIESIAPYATRITFATTGQSAASAEFKEHLGRLGGRFNIDVLVEPVIGGPNRAFESLRVARRAWAGLAGAVARHRPDHVFVAFADALLRAPLTLGRKSLDLGIDPANVEGIIVEAPYAFRRGLPWRKQLRMFTQLYGAARLPFGRLLVLTPLAVEWLNANYPSIAQRCTTLPDAVGQVQQLDKVAARHALGLPVTGRLIGCIGVLDARKGVDEFVSSFASAALKANDRLLLAGCASPQVHAAVEQVQLRLGPGRIIVIDRTLSSEEFDLAISAVDLVSITYRFPQHVGMSSMLIRAVAAGRPVLSMSQGWPGWITRQLALGWIYPVEASQHGDAIRDSLEMSENYTPGPMARELVDFHCEDNFRRTCAKGLKARLARQGPMARLGASAAARLAS